MGIAAIAALLGLYIGERVKVKGENCPLKKLRCQRGGALVATTGALAPQRSAFRPLLSHNVAGKRVKHQACLSVCNEREQLRRWRQQLVTRSIAESDAAWGATGNRGRHRQERRLSTPVYAKKGHPLEMSFL